MNKEIIKSIVLSQKEAIKFDEKIFILRDKINILDDYLNNNFIIIISWIRRSGKSMLLQFIKEKKLRSDYYINFDDNRLVNFLLDDFEKLYESFLELFGEQNVFYFDEIQLIEWWEKFVRRLHNEWKKVFITGSNSTMLSRELGTHLTWRNIQIELYPFSFQEFLKYKNFTFSKNDIYLPQNKAKIKNYLDEYINLWWFPEFLLISNKEFFKNLYDNILFKDVITRYNLRDERILKELLYFVNSNISNEVSFNKLKNIFGLSNANTIKEYIHYFENSYLLFSINKFDYSLKKQLINPKKIYSIDLWFSSSVSFEFSKNLGQKLENLVFLELKRRGKEIFYHRNKKECDFILRDRSIITEAIQVSHTFSDSETKKREIEWLKEAMDTYNLDKWFILTYDYEEEIEIDKKLISILPVWKWIISTI